MAAHISSHAAALQCLAYLFRPKETSKYTGFLVLILLISPGVVTNTQYHLPSDRNPPLLFEVHTLYFLENGDATANLSLFVGPTLSIGKPQLQRSAYIVRAAHLVSFFLTHIFLFYTNPSFCHLGT